VRAEPGGELGPGARPGCRPHLGGRIQVAEQRDHGEGERARAVDQNGLAIDRRREQDRSQRDADRVRQHRGLVADVVGDGEQLRGVRAEALGVRAEGRRAVPEVNRDRQVAGAEVAAPGVASGLAGLARRVDAARNARQPRVEHHPSAVAHPPSDHLVAQHVRKRHKRGERVVSGAVQQDLLHVGAAKARKRGLHPHPVVGGQRQLVDVLDADRREPGNKGAGVDAPADGRGRLPGQAVPEHQRLHVDPPCPSAVSSAGRSAAARSAATWRAAASGRPASCSTIST
jgi:hypothetical protein